MLRNPAGVAEKQSKSRGKWTVEHWICLQVVEGAESRTKDKSEVQS